MREVKRERAIRKEEQLKEASRRRLSQHLQKIEAFNTNVQNVAVTKAPIEEICPRPKRYDAVTWLIPCQRKKYEDHMNKLQKERDLKKK